MRVALTARIIQAPNYYEPRDCISHDWLKLLASWQLTPILMPNILADPVSYLRDLAPDLLILTGGDDLGSTPERDQMENSLLDFAVETRLPTLGVCRGLQMINHYFGGQAASLDNHIAQSHEVHFELAWHHLYGKSSRVNSFHAQGITHDDLASDLRVTGQDINGWVEAAEHKRHPISAIMWHPERPDAPEGDHRLISNMINLGKIK